MSSSTEKSRLISDGDGVPDYTVFEKDSGADGPPPADDAAAGLGGKNIGWFGSFVYIINQIFGPGMVALPIVFQQAGWVTPVVVIVLFMFISGWAATCLIEAMRALPGNDKFQQRIEYSTLVRYYFGRNAYIVFQMVLNLCLQSINIASIIVCCQSFDSFFVFVFKKTFALQLYPHPSFVSGNFQQVSTEWYGGDHFSLYFSLGYLVVMVLILPWSFWPLDENIKFQFASFGGLTVVMIEFILSFLIEYHDEWKPLPAFGREYTQIVGVYITSWAFVMVVPAWVNEKKDHVNINRTVWSASAASMLIYVIFAILCAVSFPKLSSDDILSRIQNVHGFIGTRVAAYVFSMLIIAPGIPVYSISTRYNLYVGGVCNKQVSFFIGVVAPWLVGFVFTGSDIFAQFLNWTSLFFTGVVNFVIPFILYYMAVQRRRQAPPKLAVNADYADVTELPSVAAATQDIDDVFPSFMQKLKKVWVVVLLCTITLLIVLQIVLSLYYQIALGKDILSD